MAYFDWLIHTLLKETSPITLMLTDESIILLSMFYNMIIFIIASKTKEFCLLAYDQ